MSLTRAPRNIKGVSAVLIVIIRRCSPQDPARADAVPRTGSPPRCMASRHAPFAPGSPTSPGVRARHARRPARVHPRTAPGRKKYPAPDNQGLKTGHEPQKTHRDISINFLDESRQRVIETRSSREPGRAFVQTQDAEGSRMTISRPTDLDVRIDLVDPDHYARTACRTTSSPGCARNAPVYWHHGDDERAGRASGRSPGTTTWCTSPGTRSCSPRTGGSRCSTSCPTSSSSCSGMMMLNQDPPEHTRRRALVNRGFTPRAIARAGGAHPRASATSCSTRRWRGRRPTSSEDIAAPLPLYVICELLGAPRGGPGQDLRLVQPDDRRRTTPTTRPPAEDETRPPLEVYAYANQLGEPSAARNPRDDIVTKLLQPDENGEALSERRVRPVRACCCSSRATRPPATRPPAACSPSSSTPSSGRGCVADPVARRHAPPTRSSAGSPRSTCSAAPRPRTPSSAGRRSREGDKVVVFYGSANRDEDVFADPYTFDIGRDPNPHIGFGGGGAALLPRQPPRRSWSCACCSRRSPAACPRSARPASRAGCARTSSTASRTCRSRSDPPPGRGGLTTARAGRRRRAGPRPGMSGRNPRTPNIRAGWRQTPWRRPIQRRQDHDAGQPAYRHRPRPGPRPARRRRRRPGRDAAGARGPGAPPALPQGPLRVPRRRRVRGARRPGDAWSRSSRPISRPRSPACGTPRRRSSPGSSPCRSPCRSSRSRRGCGCPTGSSRPFFLPDAPRQPAPGVADVAPAARPPHRRRGVTGPVRARRSAGRGPRRSTAAAGRTRPSSDELLEGDRGSQPSWVARLLRVGAEQVHLGRAVQRLVGDHVRLPVQPDAPRTRPPPARGPSGYGRCR